MTGYLLTNQKVVNRIKEASPKQSTLSWVPGVLGSLGGIFVVVHKNMKEHMAEYHPTRKSLDERLKELNNA